MTLLHMIPDRARLSRDPLRTSILFPAHTKTTVHLLGPMGFTVKRPFCQEQLLYHCSFKTSQLTTFKYILYTYNTINTVQFVNIAKYRTLRCTEKCWTIYTTLHISVTVHIFCVTIQCHGSRVGCSVIPALTRISCPCMLVPCPSGVIKDLSKSLIRTCHNLFLLSWHAGSLP
jgi:hypothetical protein